MIFNDNADFYPTPLNLIHKIKSIMIIFDIINVRYSKGIVLW